ncbi:Lecithin-cholesterol acyl transferase, putative [Giardia lamblia P15]|uniref:Lecithin-cholesterol acyl transferase, putative n=1 Tax=Giardia intestinalis (strain P15) TaxID=658858 RepID=E1F3N1_GIAIA|nr:Lecithin-cholesterol acyl transferase, putative [Giardia lamblia P15]
MKAPETIVRQQTRVPIILIPGLCSTKLDIVHKTTGMRERAWVSAHYIPKSRMGEKMINDVWGKPTSDGRYQSFIEDVGDMHILEGFKGCSHLAQHWGISVIHAFNPKFMLGRYFTTLKNRLKKHGYQVDVDLFCHSYDWRQPLSSDAVLGSLRRLILNVLNRTNSLHVILIGHSHGALLVRLYMQLYNDWYQHIFRFIAIGPPYDNSSAYMAMSLINGFALKIPFIKYITARNFQASSSVPVFLGPAPVASQLEEYGVNQYIPTCIFVKKVHRDSVRFARQIGVSAHDPGPTYCTDRSLYKKFLQKVIPTNLSIKDISVDLKKYGKKFPDLSSLLLLRLSQQPEKIHPQHEAQALRLLLSNIKRGALRSKVTGERIWSSNFLYVDTLLTPRYTVGIPTREAVENQLGLWEWEAYTSWTETSNRRKSYLPLRAFKHPWFYISGDQLLLREDAPYYDEIRDCRVGAPAEIVRWSSRPDILQHAYANSIYQSFRDFTALRDLFEDAGTLVRLSPYTTRAESEFVPLTLSTYKAAILDLNHKQKALRYRHTALAVKQTQLITPRKGFDLEDNCAIEIVTDRNLFTESIPLELISSLYRFDKAGFSSMSTLRQQSYNVQAGIKIPPLPWNSIDVISSIVYRSVLSLMKSLNRPGSLEEYLFEPFEQYWDEIYKIRTKPIVFPQSNETNFRYFAICGSGCKTPLHVVYNQPVSSYHELCTQIPTTIDSDGDGTVLLHSALSDGFPHDLVIDRVIVKNITHFMLIHDKVVWSLIEEALF